MPTPRPRTGPSAETGFTLVEILISVAIILVFLPFAGKLLANSQLWGVYSKHKIQAAFLAKQLIETQRQNISRYFSAPIGPLTAGKSYTVPPSPASVVLDTKGNYASINCNNSPTGDFCGTAVITVTPAVYTQTNGTQTTSSTVDRFTVTINWIEQLMNLKVPMTEAYVEDIANDPMLN